MTIQLDRNLIADFNNELVVYRSYGEAFAVLNKLTDSFYVCMEGMNAAHLHRVCSDNLDAVHKHIINTRTIRKLTQVVDAAS